MSRDMWCLDVASTKAQHGGGAALDPAASGWHLAQCDHAAAQHTAAAAPAARQASSRAAGGARKGGGSCASHLHRNMLDKAMHKKIKGIERSIPSATSPHTSPSILQPPMNAHAHTMVQAHAHMPHLHAPPHPYHSPAHGAPAAVMAHMGMVYHAGMPHSMPPTPVYAHMPAPMPAPMLASMPWSAAPQPHSH